MKKVVINNFDVPVVFFKNCVLKRYYAIANKSSLGIITREKYGNGYYKAYSFNQITEGNAWGDYIAPTLQELIEKILTDSYHEVYEFETVEELLKFCHEKAKELAL